MSDAVLAIVLTLIAVLLVLKLSSGEKIEHEIEKRYGVGEPQFVRTMGLLLGPPITPGNRVATLVNGDRIFPAMLEAIRGARRHDERPGWQRSAGLDPDARS